MCCIFFRRTNTHWNAARWRTWCHRVFWPVSVWSLKEAGSSPSATWSPEELGTGLIICPVNWKIAQHRAVSYLGQNESCSPEDSHSDLRSSSEEVGVGGSPLVCYFSGVRSHWKRPWCWERLKAGGEGDDRGWDGWMASPTGWTWVWASSRSWWWTGKRGVQSWTRLSDWSDWSQAHFAEAPASKEEQVSPLMISLLD